MVFIINESFTSLAEVRGIAAKIHAKSKSDEKKPVGNQNCLLCTLAVECQLRGMNVLPRPVYSPRDIIFKHGTIKAVLYPSKNKISSIDDVKRIVTKAGPGARYYAHVNWAGCSGGHEFIVTNIDGTIYVVDGQTNTVSEIETRAGKFYFDKINWDNSFIYRTDNKKINPKALEYNDMKYCIPWNDEIDMAYIKKDKLIQKY